MTASHYEETKVFLRTINAISSCENIHQVMFMVRWVSLARENNRITNQRFIRIINSVLNTKRKQLWGKERKV